MGSHRRSWFAIYALGAALSLGALLWISLVVLELERSERNALAAGYHQERVRLALWRMDSWFGPQLAREVARLPLEYHAYSPRNRAYTQLLNKIEPGEVLVPSPLLTFESEIIRVHFELGRDGWTSPQLPAGNWLDLAQASGLVESEMLRRSRRALDELAAWTGYTDLDRRLSGAEKNFNLLFTELESKTLIGGEQQSTEAPEQLLLFAESNVRERQVRAQSLHQVQNPNFPPIFKNDALQREMPEVSGSSPLVPIWLGGAGGGAQLCFVRRVTAEGGDFFQGFLADWARLEGLLLEQVRDILPRALLEPDIAGSPEADHEGLLLATIPATLSPGVEPLPGPSGWSPATTTLLAAWVAALVALGAVGISLRSSIRYGEKRSRFASIVTHELRTPLTTFRMYSEMLARGMVPEERRGEYLATLERESARLATLVENVLAYSRLEEGRARLRRESTTASTLLERVTPELRRRATEAGMELSIEDRLGGEVPVETDIEAVEQILVNLVDNACKYGRSREGRGLELQVHAGRSALELRLQDHGRGVPPGAARAIFHAFDRGHRDATDPHPGIGLGLALARGLARDLGGDLVLEEGQAGSGARFLLTVPRVP
jgi:signal transduction histidine kinase